ncbi:hypothetical protein LUZ60_012053 [Juncus effusus]|nr:hypothetical protein LUZ60_012053 [Juncus effusus]
MDSNWRPSQGDPTAGGGPASGPDPILNPDWRSQLPPESRPRIVSKIMDTLKRHLPGSVPEGLNELQKIAVRFEEKIYSAATSQPDYLRKISLKMLSMETKAQGPQINPASNPNLQNLQNPNRMDPGLGGMQAQAGTNPAQSLSMPQTFRTNSTNQSMPPVTQQTPAGMNSLAQPDMYANAQRRQQNQTQQNQMQQNQIPQNQTQQNQMVYQQIMRQKLLQQHQMSSGLTGQSGITAGGGMTAGSGGMQVQHNQLNPLQQHQQLQMQQNQMRQNQMMDMNNMNNNMNNSNNMMVGARGNNNNNNMNNMQQRRMQQMSQQNQNQQHLLSQFQNQQPMQQQQGGNNNNINNSNNMMQLQQQQRSTAMLQTQNGGNNNNMNNNDGNNNNVMDQRKQFMQQQQQQRVIQDVASSPASIDSTAQTGPSELAIEEVYQKLKSLKETYFMELKDMYQRVAIKLHQINPALMEDPKAAEQIEKLKTFKTVLDRLLYVLQLNKQTLQHQANMKEKLNAYEKQIISILQNHKKQIPPAQQPQIPPAQQPQIPQAQQLDPQQQIENQNHQMHGNNFNMQNKDQMQPNAFNTMNGMNPAQAVGTGMMISSHNSMMSQQNLGLKQQQEAAAQQQQRFIQPNQMKQRHMQQMLQKQHLQQQHLPLQQIQQQKQQNIINNNSQQSGQLNNDFLTDIKPRQAGLKPNNPYQPLYPGMNSRTGYFHPQLKLGTNLPVSSPQQNLQSSSSPSSQIDQVKLERTLLQPASSPFLPSLPPPVAPHPLIPDETKPVPSLHTNSSPLIQPGQTGQIPSQSVQSIGVGTPGISASPLLAEFTSPEAGQMGHHVSTQVDGKSTVDETPIERLAKALRAGSNREMHNLIRSAISDIGSVVSMVDRIAGSAPVNGSRAAVGDDLAAMTKCRIQAKHLPALSDQPVAKKMKRDTSALPLNGNGSGGGGNGSGTGGPGSGVDGLELEGDATSRVKMNHRLMQEIKEINSRLIDTELTLAEEESVSSTASSSIASSASSEGTVIKCIYTAVAISPGLRSHFASSQLSPILPLRLLVPSSYPKCSPIILNKLPEEQSRDFDDLSTKARSRFSASLRGFSEPLSLKEMAKMWDACAREVILEYAMKIGGGSFSSRYATWKTCVGA